MLATMAMPLDLPDDLERRLRAAASERGVRPEQVIIEAVEAELREAGTSHGENPFAAITHELRRMAFDGSLRSEIDAAAGDPELAVG